mmetsp:Transcript_31986/g.98715  ORF Transcript_31986/g.98715 Transcript_31986/m.98715 type:complete len:152 (-) Transcript_31986:1909-2364(-)
MFEGRTTIFFANGGSGVRFGLVFGPSSARRPFLAQFAPNIFQLLQAQLDTQFAQSGMKTPVGKRPMTRRGAISRFDTLLTRHHRRLRARHLQGIHAGELRASYRIKTPKRTLCTAKAIVRRGFPPHVPKITPAASTIYMYQPGQFLNDDKY